MKDPVLHFSAFPPSSGVERKGTRRAGPSLTGLPVPQCPPHSWDVLPQGTLGHSALNAGKWSCQGWNMSQDSVRLWLFCRSPHRGSPGGHGAELGSLVSS